MYVIMQLQGRQPPAPRKVLFPEAGHNSKLIQDLPTDTLHPACQYIP